MKQEKQVYCDILEIATYVYISPNRERYVRLRDLLHLETIKRKYLYIETLDENETQYVGLSNFLVACMDYGEYDVAELFTEAVLR